MFGGTAANDVFNVNDSILSQTVVNVVSNSNSISVFEDWESDVTSSLALNTSVHGWKQTNLTNVVTWRVNSGTTSSTGTQPDVDHTFRYSCREILI